jgi:NAD dependent epimerase/dehydratase
LAKRGYSVVAFDRYNIEDRIGWLQDSPYLSQCEVVLGDIRDYDSVSRAMDGCDAVFHLAALIGIPYSYVSPLAYVRTNVEGTYNVLEVARRTKPEQILIASTSEIYGTAQYTPIDESHPSVGQSPYSATKIAADQLAISYHRSFDSPVKIFRPFNTYGPRQSTRAVIPTIISQVLSGQPNLKLGRLDPTRDLTYVGDTCRAILDIAETDMFFGCAVNIGTNKEISIEALARKIIDLAGSEISISEDGQRLRPEKSEVECLRCDNNLLRSHTAWEPEVELEIGLEKTIAWFSANRQLLESAKRYHV